MQKGNSESDERQERIERIGDCVEGFCKLPASQHALPGWEDYANIGMGRMPIEHGSIDWSTNHTPPSHVKGATMAIYPAPAGRCVLRLLRRSQLRDGGAERGSDCQHDSEPPGMTP